VSGFSLKCFSWRRDIQSYALALATTSPLMERRNSTQSRVLAEASMLSEGLIWTGNVPQNLSWSRSSSAFCSCSAVSNLVVSAIVLRVAVVFHTMRSEESRRRGLRALQQNFTSSFFCRCCVSFSNLLVQSICSVHAFDPHDLIIRFRTSARRSNTSFRVSHSLSLVWK